MSDASVARTDALPRALSESDFNRPGDQCIPNNEVIQCEEQVIVTCIPVGYTMHVVLRGYCP